MPTVSFISEAATTIYRPGALAYISTRASSINAIASALGVSSTAIAGAMAEENESYLADYSSQVALDLYGVVVNQNKCVVFSRDHEVM